MRHAQSSPFPLYFWTTLLACCLQVTLMIAVVGADETVKPADEENLQMDNEMSKRDWNQKLQMWGKRSWSNLHGGWGLKRSVPSTWSDVPIVEKRAWDSFQGGWGKRYAPYDDEAAIEELATLLDEEDNRNYDLHDEEKRNWNKFNGGWGKRSKWDNFRGAWGKRDPAWSNLKGYWGKRSADQY